MTGEELRATIEAALPEEELRTAMAAKGFPARCRKLDGIRFLRAMILSSSSPSGGRQADVMRMYFESGAPKVARASFYDWFGEELEVTLQELSFRARERARNLAVDLPGWLGVVKDWRIVDSTTVRLQDTLKDVYSGTGDYAALKVHKTLSVGCGTTIDYHFSPASEHDSLHLRLDESWRGLGLLIDLGYASIQRLRDCQTYGVAVVVRLKENWRPKVEKITRGEVSGMFTPGTDLDLLIETGVLRLDGRAIDVVATVGPPLNSVKMRLVGVPTPEGTYRFYLTNLPGRIGPRQIADLYRVRWEIESNNKLDKSCHRLDEIEAHKIEAVHALLHASLLASIVICTLAHQHNLAQKPSRRGAARTVAPLHPQLLARMVGHAALSLVMALELPTDAACAEWNRLAALLEHMGKDPNWRRSPSILDQLRGWKITPGRPKHTKLASTCYYN
jgi:putative transposase